MIFVNSTVHMKIKYHSPFLDSPSHTHHDRLRLLARVGESSPRFEFIEALNAWTTWDYQELVSITHIPPLL